MDWIAKLAVMAWTLCALCTPAEATVRIVPIDLRDASKEIAREVSALVTPFWDNTTPKNGSLFFSNNISGQTEIATFCIFEAQHVVNQYRFAYKAGSPGYVTPVITFYSGAGGDGSPDAKYAIRIFLDMPGQTEDNPDGAWMVTIDNDGLEGDTPFPWKPTETSGISGDWISLAFLTEETRHLFAVGAGMRQPFWYSEGPSPPAGFYDFQDNGELQLFSQVSE